MKKMISILGLCAWMAAPHASGEPPEKPVTPAPNPPVCATTQMIVYFPESTTKLTPHAARAVDAALGRLAGCEVRHIEATALAPEADAPGDAHRLATARTGAVLDYLAEKGISAPSIDETIAIPVASQRAGKPYLRPVARRVHLTFDTVRAIQS